MTKKKKKRSSKKISEKKVIGVQISKKRSLRKKFQPVYAAGRGGGLGLFDIIFWGGLSMFDSF